MWIRPFFWLTLKVILGGKKPDQEKERNGRNKNDSRRSAVRENKNSR